MANHPINRPPELRRQWLDNDHFSMVTGTHDLMPITRDRLNSVMDQSARWSADQELEACCEWLEKEIGPVHSRDLRAARRPKPPSLKAQALAALERYEAEEWCEEMTFDSSIIRRALEALND